MCHCVWARRWAALCRCERLRDSAFQTHRQPASLMPKPSAACPPPTTTIGAPILRGRVSCVNSAGVVLFAARPRRGDAASSKLPARGEFTIANAYVMTMDGALGDIAGGSVHVRNGEIVA